MSGAEKFGERLRRLRKRTRLRQCELAERVGVKRSTIGVWESGRLPLHTKLMLDRLAPIFGVTPFYLRFGFERSDGRLHQADLAQRPRWSRPGTELVELCHQGRAEIAEAEGFTRPMP